MLVILKKQINKEVTGELKWRLETIPCSLSPINKPQGRLAVNTDSSESEWEKLIEKTPQEYFDLRKAPCVRL